MTRLSRSLAVLATTAALLSPALASAAPVPVGTTPAAAVPAPTARIPRSEFLTQRQIRARLDLARPLRDYYLSPTDRSPQADPDCATRGRPEATSAVIYPAARTRSQVFTYRVPGAAWQLQGQVLVVEYRSRAKARAAYARVKASVRSARHYSVVCEGINPRVTAQRTTGALDLTGRSFSWRHHLTASHAGAWRHVVATKGDRLVWVVLGREYRADLDWSAGTPTPSFPRYPALSYLESLAEGATGDAL